jgi:hypothetical protein
MRIVYLNLNCKGVAPLLSKLYRHERGGGGEGERMRGTDGKEKGKVIIMSIIKENKEIVTFSGKGEIITCYQIT